MVDLFHCVFHSEISKDTCLGFVFFCFFKEYFLSLFLFLQVLEACMKNCGRRFHNEVGKFKFLNELIKVVSPKVSTKCFTFADSIIL